MGSISPRPGRSPGSRRSRERRAYQLTVVGGTAALVAVVGTVLAIVGVLSGSVPLIAAVIAVLCALLFRSTVSR